MSGLQGARVTVVGAGVVGLCVALEAQARGGNVTIIDEGGAQPSASAVAAGMIAPAFEAALEETGRRRLELLRTARDLWSNVADGKVRLHREGALWAARPGEQADLGRIERALGGEGALRERVSASEARRLSPGLTDDLVGAVFTPEDWRLETAATLNALDAVFVRRGGRREVAVLRDVRSARADATVICAGWGSRRLMEAAPELRWLHPVSGELVRFPGAPPHQGPVIRTREGYLVPGEAGVLAGASMIDGAELLRATPEGQARYSRFAQAFLPGLAGVEGVGAAGVRAATPDGLPLVGRSEGGVHLATGFRRNGWLLAPLAARITADQLAGEDPGPWAGAFQPDRFG